MMLHDEVDSNTTNGASSSRFGLLNDNNQGGKRGLYFYF